MKVKALKTNVTRLLEQRKIAHDVFRYEGTAETTGTEVAALLGLPAETMFKTLVTEGAKPGTHYVFVVPVCAELDLKKAAKAVGEKSVAMIPAKQLLPLTGYIHGGCSPIGMKKAFPTVIDASAQAMARITFSGGAIGCSVQLAPGDLAKLIRFSFADITA